MYFYQNNLIGTIESVFDLIFSARALFKVTISNEFFELNYFNIIILFRFKISFLFVILFEQY